MARFASDAKVITCSLAMAAMLLGVAGCKSKRRLAKLPGVGKYEPLPSDEAEPAGLDYRKTAGQAIAPVMVTDDPAPTVAPTAAPSQPSGGVATLNGHPGGITRETLNRSVQGAMGSLATCFANVTHDPMVAVSFEAQPNGRPSLVRVKGAPPDAERCIRSVMEGVRFPEFEGKGVQIDLPLSFHRVAAPAQSGNRAGEDQPAAPPLFIQP